MGLFDNYTLIRARIPKEQRRTLELLLNHVQTEFEDTTLDDIVQMAFAEYIAGHLGESTKKIATAIKRSKRRA
ncbi:MAG: hypothetical protein ACYCX4_00155 [Bacillota bacterium]